MNARMKRVVAGVSLMLLILGGAWAQEAVSPSPASPEQQHRLDQMKSRGTDATLTILPARLVGNPFGRLSEVIGLLLEQQGLKHIELGEAVFDPSAGSAPKEWDAAFSEFVKGNPVQTQYVLYVEMNGSREAGITELRAAVADQDGAVVWADRLTPEDEPFRELGSPDPMSLSVLLARRLGPQFGLDEETARDAKPGKMAAIMDERSGMPPESERAPLPERLRLLVDSKESATLTVFPVRAQGAEDAAGAAELAKRITEAGLLMAEPAKQALELALPQRDPNELKTLWDMARAFRSALKENPAGTDYVLYADYAFNPEHWEQGYVHFAVCDRAGEWVIVDMANSHHPDYQAVKPTSEEGCREILVRRLQSVLIEKGDG